MIFYFPWNYVKYRQQIIVNYEIKNYFIFIIKKKGLVKSIDFKRLDRPIRSYKFIPCVKFFETNLHPSLH